MLTFERLIQAAAGSPSLSLVTARLALRPPQHRDFDAWRALRSASEPRLQPWEPLWSRDHLSPGSFKRRVRWAAREIAGDRAYPLLLFRQGDDHQELIGGVTLENIRRGAAQSAALGYWLGDGFEGRGYMTEALRAVIDFSFGELSLSRLEAACLPENERSRRLLQRVGFKQEGLMRGYLEINGAWRDHILHELRCGERAAVTR